MAAKLSARRVGLTLLELILALSLSVVLLFAVGLALRLYWRSFDVKRTNVEQAHLARAILRKMEDDLRTAVQYTPVDLSGLESMTSSSSVSSALAGMTGAGSPAATGGGSGAGGGSATGGGNGSGSGAGTGGGGAANQASQSGSGGSTPGGSANSSASKTGSTPSTQSGSSASPGGSSSPMGGATASDPAATAESTGAETTSETPPAVVGLYGSANQLQFDVSRLPRVDEYASGSPASMLQIPSDIKTLTYYVRSESSGNNIVSNFGSSSSSSAASSGSSEPSATGQGRGLMRLEMDRAVSAYNESNGSTSAGYDGAKLLADEVTSITFRYWNGTEWVSDWNSDEMGGLPLAVEIVMTMANPNAVVPTTPPAQNFATTTTDGSTDTSYRMVVNLPTASLPPPVEEPAATEGTEGAAGTTTPGSSSSPTTPGSGSFSAPAMGGSGSAGSPSSGSGSSSYGTGSKTGGS